MSLNASTICWIKQGAWCYLASPIHSASVWKNPQPLVATRMKDSNHLQNFVTTFRTLLLSIHTCPQSTHLHPKYFARSRLCRINSQSQAMSVGARNYSPLVMVMLNPGPMANIVTRARLTK